MFISGVTLIHSPVSSSVNSTSKLPSGSTETFLSKFQLPLPSESTSNTNSTGCPDACCIQQERSDQPEKRKGSDGTPAFMASSNQTPPSAVTGPNLSGVSGSINQRLELDCPGPCRWFYGRHYLVFETQSEGGY